MALQELPPHAGYSLVINLTDYPYIIRDAHFTARPFVFLPLFLLFKHAFLFSRFAKNLKGETKNQGLQIIAVFIKPRLGLFIIRAMGIQ